MTEFKDRYILGEGYPWPFNGDIQPCLGIEMKSKVTTYSSNIELEWPDDLWNPRQPKYRLVLERVEEKEDE